MKKSLLAASSFALAAALVALPTSAFADVWDGNEVWIGNETNGYEWDIENHGGIGHSYVYVNGFRFDRVVCTDNEAGLALNDQAFSPTGDLDLTVDSFGDKVITGSGTFGSTNLTATVQYRVFSAGDVLRTSFLITNPTADAITVTPSVFEDPSDSNSDNAFSTDGDNVADTSDTWYTTFDSLHVEGDTDRSAVYTKFWGKTPASVNEFSFSGDNNSDDVEFAPITIAPGESYNWIFFHSYRSFTFSTNADSELRNAADVTAAVAAGRAAVAEFRNNGSSLPASGRLIRGLNLDVNSNWGPASNGPTLANTGSADVVLGFAGLGLIALGATAVAFNRRKDNA